MEDNEEIVNAENEDVSPEKSVNAGVIVEKNSGNPFEIQVEKPEKPKEASTFWQKTKKVLSYIFIDGLSGMAIGLFATLIIGTIIAKIGSFIPAPVGTYIVIAGQIAQFMMGAGIALGMGYKLKKSPLVSVSAGVAGMLASFAGRILGEQAIFFVGTSGAGVYPFTTVGEPLCAFIAAFVALEVGSLVSGKTKVDIIVTPLVAVSSGALTAFLLGKPISFLMNGLGQFIAFATEQQPFVMGVLVAVSMGVFLTLPISSAAIGVMILGPSPLACGAAVAGCCTHMVGYAVMSFRENKWGGLLAQGLGTSMLQIPNLVKKPLLWVPPIIVSAILGPISTCVLHITSTAVGSGMGTAGLVGVFETVTSLISGGTPVWLAILEVIGFDVLLPAAMCLGISELMRKFGWMKQGDLKLDL